MLFTHHKRNQRSVVCNAVLSQFTLAETAQFTLVENAQCTLAVCERFYNQTFKIFPSGWWTVILTSPLGYRESSTSAGVLATLFELLTVASC